MNALKQIFKSRKLLCILTTACLGAAGVSIYTTSMPSVSQPESKTAAAAQTSEPELSETEVLKDNSQSTVSEQPEPETEEQEPEASANPQEVQEEEPIPAAEQKTEPQLAPSPAVQESVPVEVPAPGVQEVVQPAPVQANDEIWHISYVWCYGAPAAPSDGSIGLWADGWLIVHNNTPNGEKLASIPPRIEMDGLTYHFADRWIAGDDISAGEIARMRANNGITFQTCIDAATNWMIHYEPDGAGYGYQFINYPYTVNDNESVGYYPGYTEIDTGSGSAQITLSIAD